MVITDVTSTIASVREAEQQHEYIQVFERAVKDGSASSASSTTRRSSSTR